MTELVVLAFKQMMQGQGLARPVRPRTIAI